MLAKQRLEKVQISLLDDVVPGWRMKVATIPESLYKRPNTRELDRKVTYHVHVKDLATFIAEHGRFPCNSATENDELQLGCWISAQRMSQSHGKLSAERAELLDCTVPGWQNRTVLSLREQQWQNSLAELKAITSELGRLPSTRTPSGVWIQGQRRTFRKGTLSKDHELALDAALPSWRNSSPSLQEQKWRDSLAKLVATARELGRLPLKREPSSSWMHGQRCRLKKGTLSKDHELALDAAVPGWKGLGKQPRFCFQRKIISYFGYLRSRKDVIL